LPEYVYELRRGQEVVATGRLSDEREFAIGNECDVAGWVGIVRDALPTTAGKEVRLVVEVRRRDFEH
jgi:hypothetical protein